MGLRERLENLVVNPRLVEAGSDLDFAKSLLGHYRTKGSLTSGRREWLTKLEDKYDEANWSDPFDNEIGRSLNGLLANEELNSRDRSFVESLKRQFHRWGKLTEKQQYALNQMIERHSPEGILRRENWAAIYRENHRSDAMVAAAYYEANPPYYRDLSIRILNEENFVPSEKQFNAITKNKYAQKVIAAANAAPKYAVNSLIEGRASSSRKIRGKKAFVLKVDAGPITNAAKGVKKYLVLPIGEAAPLLVEERDIKIVKKIKK